MGPGCHSYAHRRYRRDLRRHRDARLAREVVRGGRLLADGWQILHASAVVRPPPTGGDAPRSRQQGAGGKTTTGFLLARTGRFQLLANDRVFARFDGEVIRVLPWPSAAAIGFGLLDALGWYEPVRARVRAGEQMHPTQKQKVTDALLAGDRAPLWKASGVEMKPQFFPDQLETWLGLTLATEGARRRDPFPGNRSGRYSRADHSGPRCGRRRLLRGRHRGPVPRCVRAAPRGDPPTAELAGRLGRLPHQALTMNHDPEASSAVLLEAAGVIL